MVNNKSGISAIVATVLIILITVAAVTIIWAAIIPMIQNNLASTEQFDVRLNIETASGYTARDDSTNFSSVQVRRGSDDENISQIQIIIICEGNSISFTVPAPAPNQAKTYNLQSNCTPDSISVAPIFGVYSEQNQDVGGISSEIDKLPNGSVAVGPGDIYYGENGTINYVECVNDGDCSGGTLYCFAEKCVECTLAGNCNDGNDCTINVCGSNNECSYPSEIADTLCNGGQGECDGAGNCGNCSDLNNPCYAQECQDVFCNAGICDYTDSSVWASCAGGESTCDGAGNCFDFGIIDSPPLGDSENCFDIDTLSVLGSPGDVGCDIFKEFDFVTGADGRGVDTYSTGWSNITCTPSDGRAYSEGYLGGGMCLGIPTVVCFKSSAGVYAKIMWAEEYPCNYWIPSKWQITYKP